MQIYSSTRRDISDDNEMTDFRSHKNCSSSERIMDESQIPLFTTSQAACRTQDRNHPSDRLSDLFPNKSSFVSGHEVPLERYYTTFASDPRILQERGAGPMRVHAPQPVTATTICLNGFYPSSNFMTVPFTSSLVGITPTPVYLLYPSSSGNVIIPYNHPNNYGFNASDVFAMPIMQMGLHQGALIESEHRFPARMNQTMADATFLPTQVHKAIHLPSSSNNNCQPPSRRAHDLHRGFNSKRKETTLDEQAAPRQAVTEEPTANLAGQSGPEGLSRRKPKRPLSAYNIFFRDQRAIMVRDAEKILRDAEFGINTDDGVTPCAKRRKRCHGITFEQMAQRVGQKWKEVGPQMLAEYEKRADDDKKRYEAERDLYMQQQRRELEKVRQGLESKVSDETMKQYLEQWQEENMTQNRRKLSKSRRWLTNDHTSVRSMLAALQQQVIECVCWW